MGERTVLKHRLIIVAFAVTVCVITLGTMGGCSESSERQASRALHEEVEQATKLYERALGFLGNRAYRIGDEFAPLGKKHGKPDQSKIVVLPADEIHPKALPTITKAEKLLTRALDLHKDAAPPDKAIAQTMLARIHSLRGYCHASQTARAIEQTTNVRLRAREIISLAGAQQSLLVFHKKLASRTDQGPRGLFDAASRAHRETAQEVRQINDRVAGLRIQQTAQGDVYEKLNSQARRLRIEGRMTPGQEGLTKLEEAIELQGRANAAEFKAAEIEFEINALDARRSILALVLNAAKSRMEAMQSVLAERASEGALIDIAAEGIEAQLEAYEQALTGLVSQIAQGSCDIAEAQSQAGEAYESALRRLKTADRLREARIDTDARQADILLAAADLQVRCLNVLNANQRFCAEFQVLLPTIGALDSSAIPQEITSFLTDPEAMRTDAESKYTEAIKLCKKAMGRTDRTLRWVYEGRLATAYMRLHALTQDPEALKEASKVLEGALAGKEFSPNLESVVRLRELLPGRSE